MLALLVLVLVPRVRREGQVRRGGARRAVKSGKRPTASWWCSAWGVKNDRNGADQRFWVWVHICISDGRGAT